MLKEVYNSGRGRNVNKQVVKLGPPNLPQALLGGCKAGWKAHGRVVRGGPDWRLLSLASGAGLHRHCGVPPDLAPSTLHLLQQQTSVRPLVSPGDRQPGCRSKRRGGEAASACALVATSVLAAVLLLCLWGERG
jgi:hypothetical protein